MISRSIASRALLLLLSLFLSVLRRLMMTNHAAYAGAEDAMMAGKVASDCPNGRARQTTSRLSRNCGPTGSH
jgi:hypothetical protein